MRKAGLVVLAFLLGYLSVAAWYGDTGFDGPEDDDTEDVRWCD